MRVKGLGLVLFLALLSLSDKAMASEPASAVVSPLQPQERLQQSDFPQGKRCSGPANNFCITIQECPERGRLDFFSYGGPRICLSVAGKIMEFYAPTPASDAMRLVDAQIASLQIPVEWLTKRELGSQIPLAFDSHYFTNNYDKITGTLFLGEREPVPRYWQSISGPFKHYQDRQGLGRATIVHTRIGKIGNAKDFQYTLYSSLGEPIVQPLPAKDAYYMTEEVRTLIDKYGTVDGYASIDLFEMVCYGDGADEAPDKNAYAGCVGTLTYSPYVAFGFKISFVKPMPRLDLLKWFKPFGERLRPLYLDGLSPFVSKPTPKSGSCQGFVCW